MLNQRIIRTIVVTVFALLGCVISYQSLRAQDSPPPDPAAVAAPTQQPTQPGSQLGSQPNDQNANVRENSGGIDNLGLIALGSILIAGLTISVGSIAPALGEGRAVAQALSAIAQQPDSSNTITRTLFVGLAMIESTAIYCFVVSMILLFANPFWNHFVQ